MHRPSWFSIDSRRGSGQSLVEFALILPVFLLILGATLDLGRLFYAYVAIENAAKEGALYGATNPRCDDAPKEGCREPNTVSWLIENESVGIPGVTYDISCLRGGGGGGDGGGGTRSVDACKAGDSYRVRVQSAFVFVTPILEPILGDQLVLRSTATSSVVADAFDPDAPLEPIPPDPTPTPTPSPTPTPGPSGTPGPTPGPGTTPSPTPAPSATPGPAECTVPDLVGKKLGDARGIWVGAGFTGSVLGGGGNGNRVTTQSIPAGSSRPCSTDITVTT